MTGSARFTLSCGFAGFGALICLCVAVAGCAPAGGGGGAANDNVVDNTNDNVTDNENDNTNDNIDHENENENDNTGEEVAGLPLTRFNTASFTGSGNCAVCHTEHIDEAGTDVSIDTAWRGTMMANAAKDPFFLANVATEVAEAPADLRSVIEDTCARCHMPMAQNQAVANGTPTTILDNGFLDPTNDLHDAAMDAVSCTVCHQIQRTFLDDPGTSFSGGYLINTSTEAPDRVLFGPFPDPQQPNVMQSAVGFVPTEGPHLRASGLCATCHTLYTPTLDAAGEIVGAFPEQTPFLEWQHSSFGDGVGEDWTCQSCHMPAADGAVVLSRVPSNLAGREPFSQHLFLGGNVFMLRLLRDNIEALGLTASTADFNAAIALTEAYLRTQTATLAIDDAVLADGTLSVAMTVSNLCGHKFPTSFPSHRAWIHLTVVDGAGAVTFESGAKQPNGSIAGNIADEDGDTFEPHYDVITSADQVQIYESIMADTDGRVTYTLLRGDAYAKDNRLLPSGFDKLSAGEDIAVYGAASGDPDFIAGSDEITYEIDASGHDGPFTVTARLLYETVSYRFAEHLRDVDTPLAAQFAELFDDADNTPALVTTAETVVP